MSHYHALPHAVALNARISFSTVAKPRANLLQSMRTAFTVARTRRQLAKLDTAGLADVGITTDEARFEVGRAVWDAVPRCKY